MWANLTSITRPIRSKEKEQRDGGLYSKRVGKWEGARSGGRGNPVDRKIEVRTSCPSRKRRKKKGVSDKGTRRKPRAVMGEKATLVKRKEHQHQKGCTTAKSFETSERGGSWVRGGVALERRPSSKKRRSKFDN